MDNEIQVFQNSEFGELEIIEIDGKSYFPAIKCAEVLGYSNPYKAIKDHCKGDGVTKREGVSETTNQYGTTTKQTVSKTFINEGNLYRLIARSKLPSAEKFEKWVFDEVLPSIRKHGGYITPAKTEEIINNPDFIIKLATALKTEREENKKLKLIEQKNAPKVIFADAVSVSGDTILIGELAKVLKGNGIEIGQQRLFDWLRQNGYLIKRSGSDFNTPTQRAMELELFKIKETVITHSDGHTSISKTVKVTGKGQIYFTNLFLRKRSCYERK